MLRRMTALLSAVVVVLLAAIVPNAIFATPAHAAENCLSGPSGAAPDGGYWYSQTNPITRQKCWMIGAGKAKATDSGISLPAWLNFGSSKEVSEKEVAEPAPAAGCLAAPNGQAPEGRHWVYRIDNTTGQRCWHLGDQVSRIRVSRIKASRTHVSRSEVSRSEVSRDQVSRDEVSEIRPASPSRAPAKSAAPEAPAANLPPGIADANARLVDRSSAPSSAAKPGRSGVFAGGGRLRNRQGESGRTVLRVALDRPVGPDPFKRSRIQARGLFRTPSAGSGGPQRCRTFHQSQRRQGWH